MIYLDNAATSFPKPDPVHEAMEGLARAGAGNPGRGMHRFAQSSEGAIREARRAVARLFGVQDPERVIFTLNATDALNMAIKGVLKPGDHAVTTDLEHNSVSRPLEGMAARGAITVTRLRSDDAGRIDPGALRAAMTPKTRLVALVHASNVLGIAQDLAALAEVVHAGGARLLVDASQSAGVLPMDLGAVPIDLCAFTGHKALLGPMGTGGLVVREGVDVAAWREGGTGGDSSSPLQPEIFPHYLEGGTPNAIGLAGLGAGVRWVLEKSPDALGAHERSLAARFARAIGASPRIAIAACPADGMPAAASGALPVRSDIGLVSFTVAGYQPAEVAAVLDETFGVAVRAGLHCAPYVHRRRGLFPGGTVRASVGPFTTPAEIDEAAAAVLEIAGS